MLGPSVRAAVLMMVLGMTLGLVSWAVSLGEGFGLYPGVVSALVVVSKGVGVGVGSSLGMSVALAYWVVVLALTKSRILELGVHVVAMVVMVAVLSVALARVEKKWWALSVGFSSSSSCPSWWAAPASLAQPVASWCFQLMEWQYESLEKKGEQQPGPVEEGPQYSPWDWDSACVSLKRQLVDRSPL